ncbi:MAG: molybdenum cofactor guanylyltransferase [Myxococcota bacterium]|nr:molybdenum cofactor guanylyltransferase [Myxococcota bacterium]
MTETSCPTDCAGAILIGGAARRLGGMAKGLININGRTVLQHQLSQLRPRCVDTFLVGKAHPDYETVGLPIIPDVFVGRGSPGGVHAALHYADSPWVLILACDMPNITASMLDRLIAHRRHGDVIMYRCEERNQPLVSLWRTSLVATLAQRLKSGGCNFQTFLEGIPVRYLDHPQPAAFANLNTPDDLERLEKTAQKL